jgi:hypothetical protein
MFICKESFLGLTTIHSKFGQHPLASVSEHLWDTLAECGLPKCPAPLLSPEVLIALSGFGMQTLAPVNIFFTGILLPFVVCICLRKSKIIYYFSVIAQVN